MAATPIALAALALVPERLAYVWISRRPADFARLLAGRTDSGDRCPTRAVHRLFLVFKLVQAGVVVAWLQWHADSAFFWTGLNLGWPTVVGGTAVAVGQYLNVRVFQLLGFDGVFYGNRFGLSLPRCSAFPFSVVSHPQYLGACLTVWGIFLVARFPHADWFAVPAIESILYAVSARLEG